MTTDAKKPEETKVTQLAPNRLTLAETARNTWHVTPEAGTPIDAVLDPKYWAHYAVNPSLQVKVGDILQCFAEDNSYFAELIVRHVFRGGMKVAELRRVEFGEKDAMPAEDAGEYEVKFQGPKIKWAVVRKSDKRRMSDGHEEKQQAYDWLREHQKALAA